MCRFDRISTDPGSFFLALLYAEVVTSRVEKAVVIDIKI